MDEAIIDYVRTRHRLLIGTASAEQIKKEAGTAIDKVNGTHVSVHIKGRDLQRGFPSEIKLHTHDIAEALAPPLQLIVDGIQRALADIPPELAGDICEAGVYLTGGGALLDRLDMRLSNETGIKFKIAEDPLRCVVRGSGIALEQLETLGDFLLKP
jgi:rod shape-determining protein MreB